MIRLESSATPPAPPEPRRSSGRDTREPRVQVRERAQTTGSQQIKELRLRTAFRLAVTGENGVSRLCCGPAALRGGRGAPGLCAAAAAGAAAGAAAEIHRRDAKQLQRRQPPCFSAAQPAAWPAAPAGHPQPTAPENGGAVGGFFFAAIDE